MSPTTFPHRTIPLVVVRGLGRLAPRWMFRRGHRRRPWSEGSAKVPLLLSFDVDIEADVAALPAVLEGLRARGLIASFACVGELVEQFPQEHRRILQGGHEVLNHGYAIHNGYTPEGALVSTRFYHTLSPDEMDRDVRAGHDAIERCLGHSPTGFRAPHFATLRRGHLEALYRILSALAYIYSSSTALGSIGEGGPLRVSGLVELPVMGCPEHPTSTFDTWHLLTAPDRPHALGDLPRLTREILTAVASPQGPGWINVYFDPAMALDEPLFTTFLGLLAGADHIEALTLEAYAKRIACTGNPA